MTKRLMGAVVAAACLAGAVAVAAHACAAGERDAACGNGRIDPGEQCDDGNTSDNDDCTGRCTASRCGDRIVNEAEEQCDDGNDISGDGCTSACLRESAVCGNGVLEGVGGYREECDDGNVMPHDGCSQLCFDETQRCGDGWVWGTEECDDGNRTPGDGCDANCRLETGDADAGETGDRGDFVEGADRAEGDGGGDRADGDGDVEGDADAGDSDARDVADVEGGGCVEPPPGCDLVPQCGCPAGEKCTLLGTTRGCSAAGFLSEGRACTSDVECATGLMCVPGIGSDVLICYRFCRSGSAGSADCFGPGSLCVVTVSSGGTEVPGVTLCTVNCDPVSGSGCPAGTGCKIWQESGGAGRFLTDCTGNVGTGRAGQLCGGDSDCAPGFFCPGPILPQCVQFCLYSTGYTGYCEGGYVCQRFSTPISIGDQEYGYCY